MKVPEAQPFLRFIAPIIIKLNNVVQNLTITGLHHIPHDGPAIVIANHTVHADSLILGEAIIKSGRTPHFVAGSDFFAVPGVAFILRGVNAIKVTRGTSAAKDSLDGIRDILDAGGIVLLFPEGGLTHDPQLWPMRGKTGLARLMATHPDVPIIPCAHWGNERLLNPWNYAIDWKHMGRHTRTHVVFGPALNLSVSEDPDYAELTAVTGKIIDHLEHMLVPLRQANPLDFTVQQRERRWDCRLDGDPLNDDYELNRALRQARKNRRRRRWRKITAR
ncbi:1-acyl-sn-glycerol-3-phosphate acyltransferase [Arcanobacterium phocisimile]|uniref:1-acyl-sn-glycerol-3-phosphate acyltransferase n=1 Tax=Arcanobacterium phocisimile TaxID=1302235 RepID=A0ABX7IG85_9ACTO|nr:lysophospholipid acyltransferase family protein [Arcanobacterium phocisimile]QRV01569.1 1-acyl-sn-glycerol-3-phosphate acyltransferase [Arcanobacterium phocisimile]